MREELGCFREAVQFIVNMFWLSVQVFAENLYLRKVAIWLMFVVALSNLPPANCSAQCVDGNPH